MLRRSALSAGATAPVSAAGTNPGVALRPTPSVAVLMLVQYRPSAVAWGLARLVLGERGVGRAPGLRFARVLGSGREGGFGLAPSFARQGLIAFFDDEASAIAFADRSRAVNERRERADECLLAVLRAVSSRGSWGGVSMAPTASIAAGQPLASLTRAAIRPRHAAQFWRHSPPAQASLEQAAGCRLAVGLGEAPLLRQATFSLWDNGAAMDAYARQGAHLAAIHGAVKNGWFSESMFVRFLPLHLQGRWQGQDRG